jgi:hypothetical protein
MKKIIIAALVAAATLAGCAGGTTSAPQTIYVEREAPAAPAPEPPSDRLVNSMLTEVWSTRTAEDRELLCWGYRNAHEDAWDAFDEGANSSGVIVTYDEWNAFFGSVC